MAKRTLKEDGLVNATHKEKLSQRDSEPTHLKTGGYDDLGGTGIDSEPNSVKIDAGKGVGGQDKSILGAGQNSEKSHLKTESEDDDKDSDKDDMDVAFEDEDKDDEDLDKQLDEFEDLDPVDVDADVDDDDKKKVNESRRVRKLKEDDEEDKDKDALDEDENDNEASFGDAEKVNGEGKNKVTEDDEEDKDKDALDEDEIVIKKGDDDDDKEDKGEKKENPFDKKEKVEESLKIRIRRPSVTLFESAGLSAKAQQKVGLVFESVVKDITKQVASQTHRYYKNLHESKIRGYQQKLAKQVDGYLNYAVQTWLKENRVPIRTSLRSQLAEEFLGAFQTMMKEHYIEVPESKVDVVKSLTEQVNKLKKSLTEQTAQKLKLRRIAEANAKGRHVAQFAKSANLSEAQMAKLEKLVESVPYTTAKEFRSKLGMLAESYFSGCEKKDKKLQVLPEEKLATDKEVLTEGKKPSAKISDPDVASVVAVMDRQASLNKL